MALILVNGNVYTADAAGTRAQAVAMDGERIVVVGSDEEIRAALPGADIVNLEGGTVLPGFIDAHNHFLGTGEFLASVDVRYPGVRSVEELVAAIAAAARETPPGRTIKASGFDHAKYERAPTRWDLDRATTEHPVVVMHVSGHHVLVSSSVLAFHGVNDATPDPKGGELVRDPDGHVTGMCLDAACGLVQPVAVDIGSHGPNFHVVSPMEELVDAVERAGRAFLAAGLTTVCDAQVSSRELAAYVEARRQGRLPVRTGCMPLSHQLEAFEATGLAGPFGDDRLWLAAMKLYADGSLIGGTAAFEEPYGGHEGSLYWEPAELRDLVVRAHALGWQVGVHAQGDRAIGNVLDAFEEAQAAHPREDARPRVEHAGYPTPEQIVRMVALGAVTVNQPRYLFDSGDEFLADLGDRAHRLQPLRDELNAGVRVVLSSDSDVASYRPLDTIQAAVTRRTLEGRPIGADQALTVEEAIHAHTIDAAFALRMEDRLGSVEPGKLADLVVLDADPFETPTEELADIPIRMTILGGETVSGTPTRTDQRRNIANAP